MSIDRSITGSAGKVLVLTVRDVEVSLGVTVLLGQTEINHVDLVSSLANAHKEVVWLDVTVDERLGMDVLNAGDELVRKKKHSLQGELAVAEVEKVLQARAEEIQDHGIVVTFGAEPANKRDTNTTGKRFVNAGFILQLGMLGLDALKLDGNLLAGDDVGACLRVSSASEYETHWGGIPR